MSAESTFPPGYADEFIGQPVIVVAGVFMPIELLIVGLRLVTRLRYQGKFGVDDYLILPALVFCTCVPISAIVEVKIAGVGRHLAVLLVDDLPAVQNWAKAAYAIEATYSAAVAFPKLSILASYLRIFTERPYRIAGTAIGYIVSSLALCDKFEGRWDVSKYLSNCRDVVADYKGMSVPNIVTDVVLLILPMPVIWNLHISVNKKLMLMLIFLLGSFGMVASIIRLSVAFRMTGLQDGTRDTAYLAAWSLVEASCYLITACLPRPLFLDMVDTAATTLAHSMKSSGAHGSRSNDNSH